MRISSLLFLPFTVLLALSSAQATSIPVSEDTFSTRGKLSITAGRATSLILSEANVALLRFDTPPGLRSSFVQSARLRIFVNRVFKPGMLQVRRVTSEWTEENAAAAPSIENDAAAEPGFLSVNRGKRFFFFDVTNIVRAWIAEPSQNLGLAIVSADGKLLLGSKEGSGTGYPAEVEIDVNPVLPLFSGADPLSGQIDGTSIAPGTLGSMQLAIGSILATSLAPGAVTHNALGTDAVTGDKVKDASLTGDDFKSASIPVSKISPQYATFSEEQAPNVAGGTSVANGWQRRLLNAEHNRSEGAISRNGSTITLQPGKYLIRASCPAHRVLVHQCAIRDVSNGNSIVVVLGGTSNAMSAIDPGSIDRAFVEGYLEIDEVRDIELWHFTLTGVPVNGLGTSNHQSTSGTLTVVANNNTEKSVYSFVNIIKLN